MVRKTKILARSAISKAELLQELANTYDDSKFFCGEGVKNDCDFTQGLALNRSDFKSKSEVHSLVSNYGMDAMIEMPGHSDYWVINKRLYLSRCSIADNRIHETPDVPEGFFRSECKYNHNLHVFIKLDAENRTITFLLGDKQKEYMLIERSEYVSKPVGIKMYCVSVGDLEKHINDEFFNPRMIRIGRKVLGIPDMV